MGPDTAGPRTARPDTTGPAISPEAEVALRARHGDETPAVLALADGRSELLEPLVPGLPYLRVEALWAVREEMAVTVEDVLARRTRCTLRRAEASAEAAPAVADLLAPLWGRPPAEVRREAAAFAAHVRHDLAEAGLTAAGGPRGASAAVSPAPGPQAPPS